MSLHSRLREDSISDSDVSLVEALKAGNSKAFDSVYRRYAPMLADIAYGLTGSREAADDTVQDLFLRIWQGRTTLPVTSTADLKFYLIRSLRNRLVSEHRHSSVVEREQRLALVGGQRMAMGSPAPGADDKVLVNELDKAFSKAISGMPPRMRLALILRTGQQLTNRQIADVLEISDMAAAKLVSRAREILRDVWDRHRE